MLFSDYKDLTASNKIFLLELDIPVVVDLWLNYEAGIWFAKLTPGVVEVEGSDGEVGYYDNQNTQDYLDISSVLVDAVVFTKCASLTELRSQEEGFFYDKTTTYLYLHFNDWEMPLDKVITPSIVWGFCDKVDRRLGSAYNGTNYEPLVLSVSGLKISKDPLFFGVLRTPGATITLNNKEGFFDRISSVNLYRQVVRGKIGFEGMDYSEYYNDFVAQVDSYDLDFDKFSLKIADLRKNLNKPIPYNVLAKTDWPNLSDGDENTPIPIVYGSIYRAPLLCLNSEDDSASNYTFLLADTEFHNVTSVQEVLVAGEVLSSGNYTLNASEGTLTIPDAYCGDDLDDVVCSFTGANISNALAIVKDLLENYASKEFTETNFDTVEYAATQAEARNTHLYLTSTEELLKAIEQCCSDSSAALLVLNDGRFTARKWDPDRTPVKTILKDEWINDPTFALNPSEFLTQVFVLYKKDYSEDRYLKYLNRDYEKEALKRYKAYQSKEMETNLLTEEDAQEKAQEIMEFSSNVPLIVKRKTKLQNIDLKLMDFVICDPVSRVSEEPSYGVWEVIGLSRDFSRASVELSLRFVRSYTPEKFIYSIRIISSDNARVVGDGSVRITKTEA